MSLMAFSFINWNNPTPIQYGTSECSSKGLEEPIQEKVYSDFNYNLGPRFSPIKKSDLGNLKSVSDLLSKEEFESIVSYKSVSVIIIKNERQSNIREYGNTNELTEAQLNLIQSSDYSSHFAIRADYKIINKETGMEADTFVGPHFTVVPEKKAVYLSGKKVLLDYFKTNNKENTVNLDEKTIRPAKLYFTVTKKGTITNIRLDRPTGNTAIDNSMIELMRNAPGKWKPAENANGKKMDQELVISFNVGGC